MQKLMKIVLLTILLVCLKAKFSQQPDYEFSVWDETKLGKLFMITLSEDDEKLAVISADAQNYRYYQTIYDFDGNKVCDTDYPLNFAWVFWPKQTTGFYLDVAYKYLLKGTSLCGDQQYIASQSAFIQDISFSATSKNSFVCVAYNNNEAIQYNLGSSRIQKSYYFNNATEQLVGASYSPDHEFLYGNTKTRENQTKIVIFDTESGQRKRQIYSQYEFFVGNADGDGFIASDDKTNSVYNIDKNGNAKLIWTPLEDPYSHQAPVSVCSDEIRLITLRISGSDQNQRHEIFSYDTESGELSQSFELGFVPSLNGRISFLCNRNYMSIIDQNGKVHIFKYSYPLPVWAIILIVLGSLIIVGGIVALVLYKRKQRKQAAKYVSFQNEEMSKHII